MFLVRNRSTTLRSMLALCFLIPSTACSAQDGVTAEGLEAANPLLQPAGEAEADSISDIESEIDAEPWPDSGPDDCEDPDDAFACYAVPEGFGPEIVVFESSGPSASEFPMGKVLDPSSAVTLQSGDRLVLMSSVYGVTILRGPGTHRVAARGRVSSRSAYARMTRNVDTRRRSGGLLRSVTSPVLGSTRTPSSSVPMMHVVRGDEKSLAWYGIGRQLRIDARLCLPGDARFITLERLDGAGRITYGGGGCNKRTTAPPKGPNEADGVWRGP